MGDDVAHSGEVARVLVVEDHAPARQMWADCLAMEEYEVEVACDGEEAREMLAEKADPRPVDLIVTDINMPRMNGLELARHVGEVYPDVATLVLTAAGDKESIHACLRAGVVEYLEKPVTPVLLLAHVRRILNEDAPGPGPVAQLRRLRRDMAELVRQGVDEQRAQALRWLRGGINHRFNQPLQVLYGNIRLLERLLDVAELPDECERMAQECCGDLATATDCLRDLVRLLSEIRDFVPEAYVQGEQILDLKRSAEAPQAR